MIVGHRQNLGEGLPDDVLPGQSYFEGVEERLADGMMPAESLSQVVSLAEDLQQEESKQESDPLGFQACGRRNMRSAATNLEELRCEHAVHMHVSRVPRKVARQGEPPVSRFSGHIATVPQAYTHRRHGHQSWRVIADKNHRTENWGTAGGHGKLIFTVRQQ